MELICAKCASLLDEPLRRLFQEKIRDFVDSGWEKWRAGERAEERENEPSREFAV